MNRELKEKVRAYQKALIEEDKQRRRLASMNLDYAYLEELLRRCEANPNLVIEIDTADHSHLTIKTDRKAAKLRSQEMFEQIE